MLKRECGREFSITVETYGARALKYTLIALSHFFSMLLAIITYHFSVAYTDVGTVLSKSKYFYTGWNLARNE